MVGHERHDVKRSAEPHSGPSNASARADIPQPRQAPPFDPSQGANDRGEVDLIGMSNKN